MKLNHLDLATTSWDSPLSKLFSSKKSKTLEALEKAEFKTVQDLLWIIPSSILPYPETSSFDNLELGQLFRAKGKIISLSSNISFNTKWRKKVSLFNVSVVVVDKISKKTLSLRWFNVYPSTIKQLEKIDEIDFIGTPTLFNGSPQISNPDLITNESNKKKQSCIIHYPQVNGIKDGMLKKTLNKIPEEMWDNIQESIPQNITQKRSMLSKTATFKIIHGKHLGQYTKDIIKRAKNRLIYEEFFNEQSKIVIRKNKKEKTNIKISIDLDLNEIASNLYSFKFTQDQKNTLREIYEDMISNYPMTRLLQGDVGAGKTAVAFAATKVVMLSGHQVAFMCPTESLALQHYNDAKKVFSNRSVSVIIGSTKLKQKKEIKLNLESGKIDVIFGTHALIQDDVKFSSLGLAIIDEQHKFGVNQRAKLVNKGSNVHSLIMTATPIPRSLSLTQYGDLDISTIKTLPSNRKGVKTKIITPENFERFLQFIHTRIQMKEKAYIVAPAIFDNEDQNYIALEKVADRFKSFFPNFIIKELHGKMSTDEKTTILNDFKYNQVDILISTSVIEVGINVTTATIMAIMGPERFGLSSLHQLRGRVGRGDLPGFCFLVNDKTPSQSSLKRQKIIETQNNGFTIAEEDLKTRGEGDLFGQIQSGQSNDRKVSNIHVHSDILEVVHSDINNLLSHNDKQFINYLNNLKVDMSVSKTI